MAGLPASMQLAQRASACPKIKKYPGRAAKQRRTTANPGAPACAGAPPRKALFAPQARIGEAACRICASKKAGRRRIERRPEGASEKGGEKMRSRICAAGANRRSRRRIERRPAGGKRNRRRQREALFAPQARIGEAACRICASKKAGRKAHCPERGNSLRKKK